MVQQLPDDMNEEQVGEVVDAMFESEDEQDHIPVDPTKYTNYNVNTLQPNVVYYEVVRKPNGSYYYINNQFKGIEKEGELIYENKHGDDLEIEMRPTSVIFLKAFDLHNDYYRSHNLNETNFSSIPIVDEDITDVDESEEDFSDSDMDGGRRRKKSLKKFHFSSTQKHQHGGKKTVRNVTIRHGKGHKKVTYYKGNKKISTVKKPLKSFEIDLIKIGKFIPGLFKDCGCGKKHRTRKNKRRRG